MDATVWREPVKLLQKLISFDTTNPPGSEKDCCLFIKELFDSAGVETRLISLDERRPNLWATIKSENPSKPPVLMYGHMDVVPADAQDWKYPPFSGVVENGFVYGRGAADMKSGLAMFICVMLAVKLDGLKLGFDLNFLALSDEEDTGKYGAHFVVNSCPDLLEHTGCALGEMGGYSLTMGGKRLYPINVAEKQCGGIELTFNGKSGHGSVRHHNTAMEKMARAVEALCKNRLKTRVTPEVSLMINETARGLGGIRGFLLKRLLSPVFTDTLLDFLGEDGVLFDNLLHNSINVTIVRGGDVVNVVPGSVCAEADLRVLPGCALAGAIEDVREVLRKKAGLSEDDYELEVTMFDKNDFSPDLSQFEALKKALLETDPEGMPVPFVFSAVTDGRILSKAGVMTYGFTPMRLPAGFDFISQAHAANEHIPADALPFGIETIMLFLTKYY